MGVHVYIAGIFTMDDPLIHPEWKDVLEAGRWERLSSFCMEDDRKRGALAGFLLRYAMKEEGYSFKQSLPVKISHGKPFMDGIYFNLSHSGGYSMCAVSDYEVGCDIERIRQVHPGIVRRYFSKEEKRLLMAAEETRAREIYFTRLWTLREAYAKKTGEGLSGMLSGLSFQIETNIRGFLHEEPLKELFWSDQMEDYIVSVCGQEPVERIDFPDMEQIMDWS